MAALAVTAREPGPGVRRQCVGVLGELPSVARSHPLPALRRRRDQPALARESRCSPAASSLQSQIPPRYGRAPTPKRRTRRRSAPFDVSPSQHEAWRARRPVAEQSASPASPAVRRAQLSEVEGAPLVSLTATDVRFPPSRNVSSVADWQEKTARSKTTSRLLPRFVGGTPSVLLGMKPRAHAAT